MCHRSSLTAGSDIEFCVSSSCCACCSLATVIVDNSCASCSKVRLCICNHADDRACLCCWMPKATNGNVSCVRKHLSWQVRAHLICSVKSTRFGWVPSIPPSPYGNRQGNAFSKKLGVSPSVSFEPTSLVCRRRKSRTGHWPCLTA